MSALLQLILIIIALYLLFRLFAIYIAPWLLKYSLKKFHKKFFEQNPDAQKRQSPKTGRVTIQRMGDSKDNDIPKDLGEYIDYEEVKNNQKPTDE